MRTITAITTLSLILALAASGCKNPCTDELDRVRSQVLNFVSDTDWQGRGQDGHEPVRCGTDVGSENYDQICDYAVNSLKIRWPYYECTACDAAEIRLCGCFSEHVWVTDSGGRPYYPAMLYCLASVYRIRELCECAPCELPNRVESRNGAAVCVNENGVRLYGLTDCYDADGNRVCKQPDDPMLKHPNLQQTDTCDAVLRSFECASFDADMDGIPDQYDGGPERSAEFSAENPECLAGPPGNAAWQEWFTDPKPIWEGGQIFIDADGEGDYDDQDSDGVSDSCDNCLANPNGFDCLNFPAEEDLRNFYKLCDEQGDHRVTAEDLGALSPSNQRPCIDFINLKGPFAKFCDFNLDGVATIAEMQGIAQADRDDDGVGDGCDNCPNTPNGINCLDFPHRCDANGDGETSTTERNWGEQMDSDGDGAGDACDF